MSEKNGAVGVDLGGHSIVVGFVVDGALKKKIVEPTASRSMDEVVDQIASMLRRPEMPDCPVGVGIPGALDKERTAVAGIANFDCPPLYPFRDRLAERAERRVFIENDANCHALGEGWGGAARGLDDYVVVTLGTGIGGGIVLGGRLLAGAHGMAGEPGHVPVAGMPLCTEGCGGRGHVESWFSADSIERAARRAGLDEDVKELWRRRNESAVAALWEEPLDILARGIAGIVSLLDPEAVIFGGGLSRGEGFIEALAPRVDAYLCRPFRANLDLRTALLGDGAPLIGAAALAARAQS